MDEKPETKPMGQVIQIDEARIRDHLGEMVRGTVDAGGTGLRARRQRARSEAKEHARREQRRRSLGSQRR